jgi:copper resistance protein D
VGPVLALTIPFAALSDAAYAGVTGCLVAIRWLADSSPGMNAARPQSLVRLYLASLAALIACHIVRPWLAAASMSGSIGFTSNLALIPTILSSTHVGRVWYSNSLAVAGLVVATLLAARAERRVAAWPFVSALVLMAAAKATSGHPAGAGNFSLPEISMLLHFLSIAVWSGIIIASGLLVFPYLARSSDPDALWRYGRILSRTITWTLPVILLSGVCISYRELNGTLSGLWLSGWGKILIAKLILVAVALTLGALTRFRCVQCPPTSRRAALMVRLVRAEATVMILILCISGLLANTAPAMDLASDRAEVSNKAKNIRSSGHGFASSSVGPR